MNSRLSSYPFSLAALAGLLSLSGCLSADQHRAAVPSTVADRLTVGTVQKEIRAGMSGADVATALGAPNIVTTDEQRREVWVYDKIASEVVQSSSSLKFSPFILGTGSVLGAASGGFHQSSGALSRTDRTLTIVIKFDEQKRIRDFAYHSSQF
jgi:outer membrane protein assembly factor BamE (lipoprotein component of BamABCDE complex)